MGEIAEAMLEGELCQTCGIYLGGGDGYPVSCAGCDDESPEPEEKPSRRDRKTVYTAQCDICLKYLKPTGVNAHKRDVHPKRQANTVDGRDKI